MLITETMYCHIGQYLRKEFSMEKYKISVIVPVYNVKEYLEECINSILAQDYENYEVILVDDGSNDSSEKICDSYSNIEKIKIYHKKNGGLSDARNFGLKMATGKYICFIDSDDVISKSYLSSMMYNINKYNVKIASCGMAKIRGQKIIKYNFDNIKMKYDLESAIIFMNIIGYFNVSVCNKLFDRTLFNNLFFPVGKQSEDWFILYKLIEASGNLYYDSTPKYFYRERINSITRSRNVNTDAILAAREVYFHYEKNKKIVKYAGQSYAFAVIGVYNNFLRQEEYEKCKKIRENFIQENNKITLKRISFTRKIQLVLFLYLIGPYNILIRKMA